MYFNGSDGKEIDYRRALEYYLKSGYEGDHSVALCCAGSMYYNGLGVPRDFMAAFNLYQKSIEVDRNNLDAWKNIASMHYFGDGVQEDQRQGEARVRRPRSPNEGTAKRRASGTVSCPGRRRHSQ